MLCFTLEQKAFGPYFMFLSSFFFLKIISKNPKIIQLNKKNHDDLKDSL